MLSHELCIIKASLQRIKRIEPLLKFLLLSDVGDSGLLCEEKTCNSVPVNPQERSGTAGGEATKLVIFHLQHSQDYLGRQASETFTFADII
jgi:hypothetical protein